MYKLLLLIFLISLPALLLADTISGTVMDPTGAVIPGAIIEITGGDLTQALVLTSDGQGRFSSPELKPGSYSLRVTRQGFETLTKTIDLRGSAALELKLEIAKQHEEISVVGKGRAYANSDPVYRKLRGIGLGQTFRIENFTFQIDTATFQLEDGTLTWLTPVNGIDRRHLRR